MESLGSRHVDSISKRGDDESWAVSKILIAVCEDSISYLKNVIILKAVPICLELGLPLELVGIADLFVAEFFDNITRVGVHGDHAHNFLTHA